MARKVTLEINDDLAAGLEQARQKILVGGPDGQKPAYATVDDMIAASVSNAMRQWQEHVPAVASRRDVIVQQQKEIEQLFAVKVSS